jgi:hypothetical protein
LSKTPGGLCHSGRRKNIDRKAGDVNIVGDGKVNDVYVSTDSHVIDVKGSVSIATGAGNDAITVVDFDKFGIALTSTDLFRSIENDTAAAGNQNLRIGQDLHIGMGVTVTGKATIRGGLGTDNIASASPIAGAKVKGFEGTTVNADAILDDIIDDLISAGLV